MTNERGSIAIAHLAGSGAIFGVTTFAAVVLSLLLAFPGQWIWNHFVVPEASFAHPVSYWTVFAIVWISMLLYGKTPSRSGKPSQRGRDE